MVGWGRSELGTQYRWKVSAINPYCLLASFCRCQLHCRLRQLIESYFWEGFKYKVIVKFLTVLTSVWGLYVVAWLTMVCVVVSSLRHSWNYGTPYMMNCVALVLYQFNTPWLFCTAVMQCHCVFLTVAWWSSDYNNTLKTKRHLMHLAEKHD